jgi:hypothetical protein
MKRTSRRPRNATTLPGDGKGELPETQAAADVGAHRAIYEDGVEVSAGRLPQEGHEQDDERPEGICLRYLAVSPASSSTGRPYLGSRSVRPQRSKRWPSRFVIVESRRRTRYAAGAPRWPGSPD